jgi:hypothetical protein
MSLLNVYEIFIKPPLKLVHYVSLTQFTPLLSAGSSSTVTVGAGLVSSGIHGHGGGQEEEEEGTATEEAGGEGGHDVQLGLSFGLWPVNAGVWVLIYNYTFEILDLAPLLESSSF